MSILSLLLIGLFLPLFPFSMGFNFLLGRIDHALFKSVLLLIWPLLGLTLFSQLNIQPPTWVAGWAAFTALFYAYRLLTQRDINVWVGYLATSVWSLFWIPLLVPELNSKILIAHVLGFGIPLVLLLVLAGQLKQRFGVAYTHLYRGLASTMPRFSGLLVFTILAVIATPVFPGFFSLLKILGWSTSINTPAIAILVLLTWLLWSWAGIRVIQGLLFGVADQRTIVEDLHRGISWIFVLILTVLVVAGLFFIGDMS